MKKIQIILAGVILPVALGSCSDTLIENGGTGEGRLILRPSVTTDLKSRSITTDDEAALAESCIVWVSNQKGLVRQYEGLDNVPTEGIWLLSGQYKAMAWAGDSVPASWDSRWYRGEENFSIASGSATQVDLACKIRNVAITVEYSDNIDDVLSDYTLTVGHSAGSLTWTGKDERRGYFMMNSRDKDLTVTLNGKKLDGSEYKKETTILTVLGDGEVTPATHYTLKINYVNEAEVEFGGGYFDIAIDESTIDVETTIVVMSAPKIISCYSDIANPIYAGEGRVGKQALFISSACKITSIIFDLPESFDEFLGSHKFDIINCSETVSEQLYLAGFKSHIEHDYTLDVDNYKIVFDADLLNKLPCGNYPIVVSATNIYTDEEGETKERTSQATLFIQVSDDSVLVDVLENDNPSIWTSEVTLTGTVVKDDIDAIGFEYRQIGSSDWIYVEGQLDSRSRAFTKGDKYHAVISGLTPGTKYEYRGVSGGFSTEIYSFTTEEATQLPNAGFEDWQTSSTPYLIYASGGSMFWDSGNHGSATMSKNVTVPDTGIKHSGDRSIQLNSQFVGVGSLGKFAAGNVFIGKYLATEGTNGVLGWGRPFTSRPKALKGYVKYNPVAITHESTDNGYKKGEMDNGIIYVALLDNSKKQGDSSYPEFPVVIKTKSPAKLFDKNSSDVIAYGEIVYNEATAGDGMIEFNIPLTYYRTDVKPSYIMCTASASKGGDYFAGGNGSVMNLDDLELVY